MKKVVIIGGGAAGFSAAIEFAKKAYKVTVIENERLGGLCMNRGCIPAKSYLNLISANHMASMNSSVDITSQQAEALLEDTRQMIKSLAYGQSYQMNRYGITTVYGTARIIKAGIVEVKEKDQDQIHIIDTDIIVIATGSEIKMLPHSEEYKAYSTDDLLRLDRPDLIEENEITVMGGGVTGVECALILRSLGKSVVLTEMQPSILRSMDEDIGDRMKYFLESTGIQVRTSCQERAYNAVLHCTGRTPVIPETGEGVALKINSKGGIAVDDNNETSIKGVFATGDCIGETMEVSDVSAQIKRILRAAEGHKNTPEKRSIPRCIYGPVEAISTGVREQDIKTRRNEYAVSFVELSMLGAGKTGREEMGFVKVIWNKETEEVKGIHVMSRHASMLAPFAQLAIDRKEKVEALRNLAYLHPTVSEAFREI